jgi:hypothetical protein
MTFPDVRTYYEAWWGEPVWEHRPDPADPPITVLKWTLHEIDDITIYATLGASEVPIPGAPPEHRYEYIMELEPEMDAIVALFLDLARHMHRTGEDLGSGQTFRVDPPIGGGPHGFLLHTAIEDVVRPIVLDDGRHIEFLSAVPLHADELRYVREHGPAALFDRFDEKDVDVCDPYRGSVFTT